MILEKPHSMCLRRFRKRVDLVHKQSQFLCNQKIEQLGAVPVEFLSRLDVSEEHWSDNLDASERDSTGVLSGSVNVLASMGFLAKGKSVRILTAK